MQDTSKQYDAVIESCKSLFTKKMSDYGCAWRILRLPSLTDQIFIKKRNGFYALVKVEQGVVFIGRMDCIRIEAKSQKN